MQMRSCARKRRDRPHSVTSSVTMRSAPGCPVSTRRGLRRAGTGCPVSTRGVCDAVNGMSRFSPSGLRRPERALSAGCRPTPSRHSPRGVRRGRRLRKKQIVGFRNPDSASAHSRPCNRRTELNKFTFSAPAHPHGPSGGTLCPVARAVPALRRPNALAPIRSRGSAPVPRCCPSEEGTTLSPSFAAGCATAQRPGRRIAVPRPNKHRPADEASNCRFTAPPGPHRRTAPPPRETPRERTTAR